MNVLSISQYKTLTEVCIGSASPREGLTMMPCTVKYKLHIYIT